MPILLLIAFSANVPSQKKPIWVTKERTYLTSGGELRSRTILNNLKRFRYDDGGSITCKARLRGLIINGTPYRCDESDVRDFIWTHLNEKKRGYIRFVYQGIDAGSQEHIFIEPDEDEVWRVTWWTVQYSWNHRTEISLKGKLMPARVNEPETGEWKLQFKNKEGKVLTSVPYDER